ncbi:MAG: hypothetical protein M3N32_00595 [Actinomycetota bacterium]|nr:hypothetical protein [Actinomycetota bacterium]
MSAATWTRRGLTHPGLLAGVVAAAAVVAILQREDIPAVLLSGVVVGVGLSGSV